MIKNFVAPILLAMGFMLLSLASAQAEDRVCNGPWLQIENGKEWGLESSCNCLVNGTYVRGGALASNIGFGYLWSQGKGRVRVILEATQKGGGFDGKRVFVPLRANGAPYSVENGGGLTEQMYFPQLEGEISWTRFYRSECFVRG